MGGGAHQKAEETGTSMNIVLMKTEVKSDAIFQS